MLSVFGPPFLNHCFNWAKYTSPVEIRSYPALVSQSNISSERFRAFRIPVPKPEDQDEIVEKLGMRQQKAADSCTEKRLLDGLFSTVLHQLMTAKVRVHDLDLDTPRFEFSCLREESSPGPG